MSLRKAIESGKEHREEYRHAKAVDRTCRNHGGRSGGSANECPWCMGNRTYKDSKRKAKAIQKIIDFWHVDYSQMIGSQHKTNREELKGK